MRGRQTNILHVLKKRGLVVYKAENSDFLKIMKDKV